MRDRKGLTTVSLLAVVILLNLPAPVAMRLKTGTRDNVAPFQNVLSMIVGRVGAVFASVRNLGSHGRDERARAEELASLRHRVRQLEGLETSNRELRKQLEFRERHPHKLIACAVVARGDASGWWQTVRLNKGTDNGIAPDMAVISVDGLIGRTTEVSRDTADVLLITDPNCKVACKFVRTAPYGIVRGTGVQINGNTELEMLYAVRPCMMDYVDRDVEVLVGDEVVTSGLGGVFPAGLLLGHVSGSEIDVSGLYQRASVTPAARMDALGYAFVVKQNGAVVMPGRGAQP